MKRAFLAFLIPLLFFTSEGRGTPESEIHVLCYHNFDGDANIYSFGLDELDAQIRELKSRGYGFVTWDQVTSGNVSGKGNILVTIDDGKVSAYHAYREVFRRHGIKPLYAIYPSVIGARKYAMNWEQLRELVDDGCGVAAHGYSHQYVNETLFRQRPAWFHDEIYLSKKVLEQKLDISVDTFIYPFGSYSDVTLEYLSKAGYRYAFTVHAGVVDSSVLAKRPLLMPRLMLTRPTAKRRLASLRNLPTRIATKENKKMHHPRQEEPVTASRKETVRPDTVADPVPLPRERPATSSAVAAKREVLPPSMKRREDAAVETQAPVHHAAVRLPEEARPLRPVGTEVLAWRTQEMDGYDPVMLPMRGPVSYLRDRRGSDDVEEDESNALRVYRLRQPAPAVYRRFMDTYRNIHERYRGQWNHHHTRLDEAENEVRKEIP